MCSDTVLNASSDLCPRGNVDGSPRIVTGIKYFVTVPIPGLGVKILRSDLLSVIERHDGVGLYRHDGVETIISPRYGGGSCGHQSGLVWIWQQSLGVILIRKPSRTPPVDIGVVRLHDGDQDPRVVHKAVHQVGGHSRHQDTILECANKTRPTKIFPLAV